MTFATNSTFTYGTKTITTGTTSALAPGNYTVTMSWTGMSSTTYQLMTGQPPKIKFKDLDRGRGWNAKKQVRCVECSRFAKVISEGGLSVECGRCGKCEGYVGKRF